MKKRVLWVGLLLGLAYLPVWHWMIGRWLAPGSYYSHGFLIPLMSAYLIWRKKGTFAFSADQGKSIGLVLVLIGLILLLFSAFWQIYFTGGWSFLLVFLGTLIYLYGWAPLKSFWFPLLFLSFMIPIPLVMVADFSLKLKLLAAAASMEIIEWLGIIAIREGSYIHLKGGTMIVGDICSGLRSLIALLAFGAFFSYIAALSTGKKIILFLSSMPIAWVANIARIVALTLIADHFGISAASGFTHDASGMLIFVVAFILLFSVEKLLRLFSFKKEKQNG